MICLSMIPCLINHFNLNHQNIFQLCFITLYRQKKYTFKIRHFSYEMPQSARPIKRYTSIAHRIENSLRRTSEHILLHPEAWIAVIQILT